MVKDLSAGAEEDLEGKGMKLRMNTCASLVLVQPGKEAWHSFGHGGTLLAHVDPLSYSPGGLTMGSGSNADKQGNPIV